MRKIILVGIVVLSLFIGGCGVLSYDKPLPDGFNDDNEMYSIGYSSTVPRVLGDVNIAYHDNRNMVANKLAKMSNKMAPDREIKRAIKELPKGGMIAVSLERRSIDSANTENFEYIIVNSNGKQVLRKKGEFDIPHSTYGEKWLNSDVIYVPYKIEIGDYITFYVIDNLYGYRDKFIIKRKK